MKEKCFSLRTSLYLPCKTGKQMRHAGGVQLQPHSMETWGKVSSSPILKLFYMLLVVDNYYALNKLITSYFIT
jgi:hypothetical protein